MYVCVHEMTLPTVEDLSCLCFLQDNDQVMFSLVEEDSLLHTAAYDVHCAGQWWDGAEEEDHNGRAQRQPAVEAHREDALAVTRQLRIPDRTDADE